MSFFVTAEEKLKIDMVETVFKRSVEMIEANCSWDSVYSVSDAVRLAELILEEIADAQN